MDLSKKIDFPNELLTITSRYVSEKKITRWDISIYS